MTLGRLKPAVPKCWLFAACAMLWSTVGVAMVVTAIAWVVPEGFLAASGFGLAGAVLALGAFRLGFGKIARRNIQRLRRLPERGCFFAFQAWKSYLIIAFMIALGSGLRHSSIPRHYLAVVYTMIGGALLMGSGGYFRHLNRLVRAAGRRHR